MPKSRPPYPPEFKQRMVFSGFLSPVSSQPAVNVAKAGSAIPVKFSLGGKPRPSGLCYWVSELTGHHV
jgi:hypothetical protein